MRTFRLVVIIALLILGTAFAQQASSDLYISSLQMPCYPPLARQARVQGTVTLEVLVAADGSVSSADVVGGHPLLREFAKANVQTWKLGAGQGVNLSGLRMAVQLDYKLADESGWDRCAARVIFESPSKVTIVGRTAALVNYGTTK